MALPEADRDRVRDALGRDPSRAEAALFENLWSEHCAYRSSRPLLSAFDSEGVQVVVGPGDDAAVVALDRDHADDGDHASNGDHVGDGDAAADDSDDPGAYLAVGIESHNHPSYVDPYDGAATGVGGIVRDIISMGAYPIALADCLYFGEFDRDHSRYLLEGVVEGISDYGNAIGVPTVGGSTAFHPGYEGNPLVNVACVGLLEPDQMVTAAATEPGNQLVLVGNATGRDGLGGASFASEDLAEDAETEDRPAVQVGDPYAEKLLIEASEVLLDRELVVAARDLGAAGLGGATCEMAAKGEVGARIELDAVHQREPGMNALEILLAESQERMCYEVRPENVDAVREVAERFDLGCSVIGEVTDDGRYHCTFEGETVVDTPAELLADGAPMNDLDREPPGDVTPDVPDTGAREAFEAVVASPNTASKRWVYRQYDHEVGVRTALGPGDDAAVLAVREARASAATEGDAGRDAAADGSGDEPVGVALSAGASPNWTDAAPYEGARAVALENATNLAAKGATPLAAVDCLNGGNPETPSVYDGFASIVEGLADMCGALDVPVVGGNVSLYNDSAAGPIPPTPTVAMLGTRPGVDAPPAAAAGEGELLLVGGFGDALGGSEYLAQFGGADRFPALPDASAETVAALAGVARADTTLAVHDVSDGGLAVALAELVGEAGVEATLPGVGAAFCEAPGRAVIETTDPAGVEAAFDGIAPVERIGHATAEPTLDLTVGGAELTYGADDLRELRATLERALE